MKARWGDAEPDCLIIGGAKCVEADLRALRELWGERLPLHVIAVNEQAQDFAAMHQRRPDYGVSRHWGPLQKAKETGGCFLTVCGERCDGVVDIVYDEERFRHGGSGLYAVGWALTKGYARIMLAGCPMDHSEHYYGPERFNPEPFCDAWVRVAPDICHRVQSLSGWTHALLVSGAQHAAA